MPHRTLFVLFATLGFGTVICLGQNTAGGTLPSWKVGHTGGYTNGRYWKAFTLGEKVTYLMAFQDGAGSGLAMVCPSDAHSIDERVSRVYPSVLTESEILKAVDAFYSLPENGAVPIMAAITASAMRASGVDEAEIQKWITVNRSASAAVPR